MAIIPFELTALSDKYKELEGHIFEAREQRALPLAEELRAEMERLDIYTGRVPLLYGEMIRAMRRDAWPEAGRYYALLGHAMTDEIEKMMKMGSSSSPEEEWESPLLKWEAMFEHYSDIEELEEQGSSPRSIFEREKEIAKESIFPYEAVQRINREMGYNAAYEFLYYYYVNQDLSIKELGRLLGRREKYAGDLLRAAGILIKPKAIVHVSRLAEVGEPSKRILLDNEWFWSVVVVPDPFFAYYYGFVVGDGTVERPGKRVDVSIGVRTREGRQFYSKVLEVCESVGRKFGGKVTPLYLRIRLDGTLEFVETLEEADCARIRWFNAAVAKLFKLRGEWRWDNLEWMLERKKLAAHLIAGYWDADGYIAKKMRRNVLASTDRKLLETVGRYLMKQWGIETTLRGPYTTRLKRAYKGVVEELETAKYELFVPAKHHPRFVEAIGVHMKHPVKRERMGLAPDPGAITAEVVSVEPWLASPSEGKSRSHSPQLEAPGEWYELKRERFRRTAAVYREQTGRDLCEDIGEVITRQTSFLAGLVEAGKWKEIRTETERLIDYLDYLEFCRGSTPSPKRRGQRKPAKSSPKGLMADPPQTPYPLIRTIEGELWEDFKYFFHEDRAEQWGSQVLKPHGVEYRVYRVDDVWALGVRHDPMRLTYEKSKTAALLVPPS